MYITNHIFLTSLLISIFRGFVWWYTVQYERIYINSNITWNLKVRILLFILSELILFSRFFWGFFNSYISVEIDNRRIISVLYNYLPIIDALSVPLLNTLLLLSSGISVTWSHHSLEFNNSFRSNTRLILTYLLRILFAIFQFIEYIESNFSISSRAWGSVFFRLTRFHRAHVFIRTNFLILNTLRMKYNLIIFFKHIRFLSIAWYWHFVDLIWVRLYILLYIRPVL